MDTISSTEFRRTFHSLTKPTTVLVHGHTIGFWTPAGPNVDPAYADDARSMTTISRFHELKREFDADPRFGQSRPAPKPGKR